MFSESRNDRQPPIASGRQGNAAGIGDDTAGIVDNAASDYMLNSVLE